MPTARGSVLADVRPGDAGPRNPWWRRSLLILVCAFVVLGAVGLLGVRSTTESSSKGGFDLSVEYAKSARAGLDVPFTVTVERDGGFDGPVSIGISAKYLRMYESQGIFPEPTEQSTAGGLVVWTFSAPPPGQERLVVDFDAYVQPSEQRGNSGTVAVLVDGERIVEVDIETWLAP